MILEHSRLALAAKTGAAQPVTPVPIPRLIRNAPRVAPSPAQNPSAKGENMSTLVLNTDKKADLAGPGIGDYKELENILPRGYRSLLTPKETQQAVFHVKRYIEDNLCKELNLMMVEVPLIVDVESGVNDMLDRDGSRTPVQFHISNDRNLHPI